jgi:hypothetical protein
MPLTNQQLQKRRERDAPYWLIIIWGILLIASGLHVASTRSLDDIVVASRPIGLALAAVLWLVAIAMAIDERSQISRLGVARTTAWAAAFVFFSIVACMAAGVLFYVLGASGILALPLVAAIFLFAFRLKLRSFYGLSEAVVGFWVGVQQLGSGAAGPALVMAMLTASVYLMVRGFDNIHQGLTKDPKDPVATALLAWLRQPWRL